MSHRYATPVIFNVDNPKDRIHIRHRKGFFYEEKVLETIAGHFPKGGTFCDIGANVGNHALYMLLLGGAARVIPVEPNPDAIALFCANIMLNRLADRVDFTTLGYGLGGANSDDMAIHAPKGNLGWARLRHAEQGEATISVRTGDTLLGDTHVDFIKMDVEGMEIGALEGLQATIARDRPVLFVEVDHANSDAFQALMAGYDYGVHTAFDKSGVNQNFLLLPKEKFG
jgi:FkbM family methyltransferase